MTMQNELKNLFEAQILDDLELTLGELCRVCSLPADQVIELVEEGVLEPQGDAMTTWRFQATSIRRVYCVQRLTQDLGVNLPGAALAIELLDEMNSMRQRLARLEELIESPHDM